MKMGAILEEIPYQDIHFEEIVGRGSFGVVYRARWKGQIVAVKRAETETEIQSFRIEVRQLQKVCHPNIITIYGVSSNDVNPLCLVMEFADCGSLYQFLHGTDNSPKYSCAHAVSWLLQCAKGVAYLHGMKPKALIHRDLKPPNILLTDAGRTCKICDFGTACEAQTYLTNNRGSAAWMAPEVFEANKYTEKCDVFSFGIIIWEVLTRMRPYDEIGGNIYRIMWAIHRGIRPPAIRGCPPILQTLMEKCWTKNPADRPSMTRVVRLLELVLRKVKSGGKPVSWVQSNPNLSQLRSIEEGRKNSGGSGQDSSDVSESGSRANTVLFRGESWPPTHTNRSPTHTNTINILPIVEADASGPIYTTLCEPAEEEEDDNYSTRFSTYSSTFAFPTVNEDHGFVEHNLISPSHGLSLNRPSTLNLRNPAGNVRLSCPNGNFHFEYTPATRTVQRVQTYTIVRPSESPADVASRHLNRLRSDPDEFGDF